MCDMCDQSEDGGYASCQNCGTLICFDVKNGDDVLRPAVVTSSGDVYCDQCGRRHEDAEDSEADEFGDPFEEDLDDC